MSDKPVSPGKGLASISAGSLTDSEATEISRIVGDLVLRYGHLPPTSENLWAMADEAKTRLHERGFIVEVDIGPVLEGKPPIIDILGKINNLSFQQPHDHEQNAYEVKKSRNRSELYLGEKYPINSIPAKKRAKGGKKGQ